MLWFWCSLGSSAAELCSRVPVSKQEGARCLLLVLANSALTVTATIITAISAVAINNTTAPATEARRRQKKIKQQSKKKKPEREAHVCLFVGQFANVGFKSDGAVTF